MICETIKFPGGSASVCSRGPRRKRRFCAECQQREHTKLCDGKRGSRPCDKPLCDECAVTLPDPKKTNDTLDFCRDHAHQAPAEQLPLGGSR